MSESQRRLIEAAYGLVGPDNRVVVCVAHPGINGGVAPVVYVGEWDAATAAGAFVSLVEPGPVPYRCAVAADEHYHVCAAGLEIECPRCGAAPGMVCYVVAARPGVGAAEQRTQPHPERLAVADAPGTGPAPGTRRAAGTGRAVARGA